MKKILSPEFKVTIIIPPLPITMLFTLWVLDNFNMNFTDIL